MFRRAEFADVKLERRDENCPLKNILVTGGLGFIGSNFINHFMRVHPEVHVYNYDKMDYCSNVKSIEQSDSPFYHFIKGDITNTDLVMRVLKTCCIDTIINFAAESHVDNSFGNSLSFTYNNVYGTHVLLECARVYEKIEKFIHVSTDEVYGQDGGTMSEEGTLNPTNPYAATKAAVEYIVKSYHISFGLPCIITRGNNVYGPHQFPEKIIPRFIMLHHAGKKLTIQGDGSNTRTFIHVSDVAKAFILIVDKGVIGDVYNIGSQDEKSVMDIARLTVKYLRPFKSEQKELRDPSDEELRSLITFVKDRDFNDMRYDISSDKLRELGWRKEVEFEEGFKQTVDWYVQALEKGFWDRLRWDIANSESTLTQENGYNSMTSFHSQCVSEKIHKKRFTCTKAKQFGEGVI